MPVSAPPNEEITKRRKSHAVPHRLYRPCPGTRGHRHRGSRQRAGRRSAARPPLPRRGDAWRWQDHAGAAVPARRARARRKRPVRHVVGNAGGTGHRGRLARVESGRHRGLRTRHRRRFEPGVRAIDPLPGGSRARGDHARHHGRGRTAQPEAARVRQPVGNAVAGAGSTALPAPDPGTQALLRVARLHCRHAGRHDLAARRPAAAQHRARRARPGAVHGRLRPGAPASAHRETARCALPRRRARPAPRHGRHPDLSAADRGRAPHGVRLDHGRRAPRHSMRCWAAGWRAAATRC